MPTGRGRATRDDLVAAAWELIDELTLSDIVALAGAAAVAEEAGVTTGAYFHHFPHADDLAAAMLDALLDRDQVRAVRREQGRLEDLAAGVEAPGELGAEARRLFGDMDHPGGQRTLARVLLVSSRPPGEVVDGRRLADHLADRYWTPAELGLDDVWRLVLRLSDRLTRRPFDLTAVTRLMHALAFGFLQGRLVDPERFSPELFAKSVVLMMGVVTTAGSDPVGLAELQAGALAARSAGEWTRRRDLAGRAAGVLDGNWCDVTLEEVAGVCKVGEPELARLFGSVRRVAGFAFGHVLSPRRWFGQPDEVAPADARSMPETDDPLDLHEVLLALVTSVRSHPELAAAFVAERASDMVRHGMTLGPDDIREAVPAGREVLRRYVAAHHGVTVRAVVEDAVTVVDAALALGLHPAIPVDDAVEMALASRERS